MKRFYLFLFLLLASLVFSSPVLAADSTSFDPTTVMVQSVGASIPVGTVITWPSNSWPSDRDNWLECNGQSISSAVYPELVALIGASVPDYRGISLRCQGSQMSTHYGAVTHSSVALGELQGDAIRNIWGIIDQTGIIVFQDHYGGASLVIRPAIVICLREATNSKRRDGRSQVRHRVLFLMLLDPTPLQKKFALGTAQFGILSEQGDSPSLFELLILQERGQSAKTLYPRMR